MKESKKNSFPVIRTGVSKNRKSLKSKSSCVSNSEVNEFNMMTDLTKTKRHEIFINQISSKWNYKVKRFVNIHEIMFSPQILIFTYAGVLKATGANTPGGEKTTLDRINLEKIKQISQTLLNGFWKPGIAKWVLIPKKNRRISTFNSSITNS